MLLIRILEHENYKKIYCVIIFLCNAAGDLYFSIYQIWAKRGPDQAPVDTGKLPLPLETIN